MTVAIKKIGKCLWVALERPEQANAIDTQTVTRLMDVLAEAEADASLNAYVLTGVGKVFSAGADLAVIAQSRADQFQQFLELFRSYAMRLERSRLITIAAVNGAARAGGLELALACDFIIASASSTFGDAHLLNDILPGGGSTARLPRAIGWQRAKWLILSGRSIDAQTACDWSLVHEVARDGDLVPAVERFCGELAINNPLTVERAKALLSMIGEQPLSASLQAEITMLEAHFHSDAFKTGINRFLNRKD